MDEKALDELLEKNFSNVNSWLNFAEAKNAANIAFVVASIAAIFSLEGMNILLYVICVFLIISGIGSLISFLPRVGNKMARTTLFFEKSKKTNGDNLVFFENIKEYSGDEYLKQICKMYFGENNYSPTKYQSDLSDEIVYNANVASNKYKIFRLAVLLDIVAFAALVFFIIMA